VRLFYLSAITLYGVLLPFALGPAACLFGTTVTKPETDERALVIGMTIGAALQWWACLLLIASQFLRL